MKNTTKPPIGIMPKHIWRQERTDHIREAIDRFNEAGKRIPEEWYSEIAELAYPFIKDEVVLAASNAMNALSVLTHGLSASKAKGAVAIDMENVEDTFKSLQKKMAQWKTANRFVTGTKESTDDITTHAEFPAKLSSDINKVFRDLSEMMSNEIWRRHLAEKCKQASPLKVGGVYINKEAEEPVLFVKSGNNESRLPISNFGIEQFNAAQSQIVAFRDEKLYEKFVETLAPLGYSFADQNELIEFMKVRKFIRSTPSSHPQPNFGEVVSWYFIDDRGEQIRLFTYRETIGYNRGLNSQIDKYSLPGLIQIEFLDDEQ